MFWQLPFALIFAATWITGIVMKKTPGNLRTDKFFDPYLL